METNMNKISFTDFKWLNEPKHWKASKEILEFSTDEKTDFWQRTLYEFVFNTGHLYGVELKEDFTFEVCVEANFTTLYDQAGLMIYIDEKHWLKTGIEYNDGQSMIGSVLTNDVSDWATDIITESNNKVKELEDIKHPQNHPTNSPPSPPLPTPLPPTSLTSSPLPTLTHLHPVLGSNAQEKLEKTYLQTIERNIIEKEYENRQKRASEIHELEMELLKEKLREAKAKADLAELVLQQACKGVYPGDPKKFYLRLTRQGEVVCVKYSTDNITWTLLRLCPFPKAEKYFVGPMSCTPKRGGLEVKFSNIKITKPAKDILHSN